MDYRTFEQRLLETIFTTDVPISPATIAYLYKIPTEEASELLQKAAVAGVLNIDSDEHGNLIYQYPNRPKFPSSEPVPSAIRRGVAPFSLGYPPQQFGGSSSMVYQDPVLRTLSVQPNAITPLEGEDAAASITAGEAQAETKTQPKMGRCPFCSEVISISAKKCPHCYEYLDYALREMYSKKPNYLALQNQQQAAITRSTTTSTQAALLSFFMPGLGQMVNGQIGAGVLWLLFTCLGYVCFIIPGMVLHILCIINAARQNQLTTGNVA